MYVIFKFGSRPICLHGEGRVYELNHSQPSDDHRHDLASLFRTVAATLGPDNKTSKRNLKDLYWKSVPKHIKNVIADLDFPQNTLRMP